MKLPTLRIEPSRVFRIENDILFGGAPTPVGQVFAFHSAALLDAARAMTSGDLMLHEFLLHMAIEGLWAMRTRHLVLVGYIPHSETAPVIRLFLMSRRELPFGNFTAAITKYPGYMEPGRDFVRGNATVPLAYWEYPSSAYALWSASADGVPFLDSELEAYVSGGLTYWMIHREFEFVSAAE
jgi:hypothetical protein